MEPDRREISTADFVAEAWDLLGEIESWVSGPSGRSSGGLDLADLLHRLKGSAALYGLGAVSRLAAFLESQAGRPDGGREALAAGVAWLRETFGALERLGAAGEGDLGELAARFPELGEADGRTGETVDRRLRRFARQDPEVLADFLPEMESYLEGIVEALAGDPEGSGPPDGDGVLRRVHTIKGTALMVGCEPIGSLAHAMEGAVQEAHAPDGSVGPEVRAALAEGLAVLRRMVEVLGGGDPEGLDDELRRSLARLAGTAEGPGAAAARQADRAPEPRARRDAPPPVIRVGLDRLDRLAARTGELGTARSRLDRRLEELDSARELVATLRRGLLVTARELERKYLDPAARNRPGWREGAAGSGADLAERERVLDLDRDLDRLARRVGEMESDLGEVEAELGRTHGRLHEDVLGLGKLVRDLRGGVTRARLVPVDRLFARFERLGSGLARDEGKQVRLEIDGRGVELDAAVAQEITEPLLHLARNAVTHGLEPPDERTAAGKPEAGVLALRAYPEGRFIHLEVEDDGRGIDPSAVARRAVELGFLPPERAGALDRREALDLVFLPGLSTRREITAGGGRGVGMDAVRAAVARLHGGIRVETETGLGTRITLRLPLTQVVSEALCVGAGGGRFLLPALAVRSLLHVAREDAAGPDGGFRTVRFEDAELPVVGLSRALGLPEAPAGGPLAVVVVQVLDRAFGLAVDELLGLDEVAVQGLGELLAPLGHLAGAAVSADGDVLLLLDPLAFVPGGRLAGREPVAAEAPRPAERRTSVLLVDDSVSVRRVLARRLGRLGLAVTTARDGQEALELLRQEPFDVLVTDLEMPRMSGYELVETVRRRPATRRLPVVIVTTRTGLAREVGADRFLTKPVDHEALAEIVRELAAASGPDAAGEDR
jgi:chemosensory pili system protein ChpA (sensor histidine kinase/response regulator)